MIALLEDIKYLREMAVISTLQVCEIYLVGKFRLLTLFFSA